ncbi:MAG: DUF4132 domain-containing protein [Anaerolineales bacterium]|nr:DUF4132 domain-containing protein [Anaerolineales bacterium]
MLSSREARERLNEFETINWQLRRRLKITRLPSVLQPVFSYHTQHYRCWLPSAQQRKLDRQYQRALHWLGSTSKWNRRRIFRILFPGFTKYVMAGWDLFQDIPYQSGYHRKAFRCPHNSAVVNNARMQWILSLFQLTIKYKADIRWLAEWAAYLTWGSGRNLGVLFAAAINHPDPAGEDVYQILRESALGEHPVGAMGSHVITAMLVSSHKDGWEFIEKLLLAAQRQEGLRQTILEAVDESHPEAFVRILRLILDENLIRFSSVVRAANVWFGLEFDVKEKNHLKDCLEQVLSDLSPGEKPLPVPNGADPLANYLRLWTIAYRDAENAVQPAAQLLKSDQAAQRFVGVLLLSQLNLTQSYDRILPVLDDPDLSVAARALHAFQGFGVAYNFRHKDLFERLERNLDRYPKKKKILPPKGFLGLDLLLERSAAAGILVRCLGRRSSKRLIPYLPMMDPGNRAMVASLLAESGRWDQDKQELFIELLGDLSSHVRVKAIEEISKRKIKAADIEEIESLLTRKAGDLRRGLISILLQQSDRNALASIRRLLETGDHMQRLAGLEILRLMKEENRKPETCTRLIAKYAGEDDLSSDERILVEKIIEEEFQELTLENGLGLFDPGDRTRPTPPRSRRNFSSIPGRGALVSETARHCLVSLDDHLHKYRDDEVVFDQPMGKQEELLGNIRWLHFRQRGILPTIPAESFPLRDQLTQWWDGEGAQLLLQEPLMLYQALAYLGSSGHYRYTGSQLPGWQGIFIRRIFGKTLPREIKYPGILEGCLEWLIYTHQSQEAIDSLLDAFEASLRMIPRIEIARRPDPDAYYSSDWRSDFYLLSWLGMVRLHREFFPANWQDRHHQRLWGLLRWMDEPGRNVPRHRPTADDLLYAFQAGAANQADVIDHLIGPRRILRYGITPFNDFSQLSRRNPPQLASQSPEFLTLVTRCRQRVCEIEMTRGDMPTVASGPALALRWSGEGDVFLDILKALGKTKLVRGWIYDQKNKASVLSRMLRVTYPGPEDTEEAIREKFSESGLSRKQLIRAAVYAPQWVGHIEQWLGWEGFSEGVWWIHAHTKDNRWSVEQEIREEWIAEINSRTPLTPEDLLEGAVDVAWFQEMYALLGPERWQELYQAAVYASSGIGHTRAKLFADAMLGNVTGEEVHNRLTKKRHQDSVRALGLVPLPKGSRAGREILERYQTLQEFQRSSRKFGSQRQASEKLAVRIALENLARTAGYPDPARLQWAMETDEVADLAAGPLVKVLDGVEFTLSINSLGEPDFSIARGEKILKSVPAKLRKKPQIKELRDRKTAIKRQASRMRSTLEGAMCRGDKFYKDELHSLMEHPVLKPMISQLVFISEESSGYLIDKGNKLEGLGGNTVPIKKRVAYRIAHPIDLLQTEQWHTWQRECFRRERIQPFKQIYRELYILTPQEKEDGDRSRRYAGHQVNPRQSLAILGQRGWVTRPETGLQRTFHNNRITAHVHTQTGYLTPQEVEGITIDSVLFSQRGEWKSLPLSDVPPLVFSETMRDLDLVVSVAHMGGVDPEASASTVQMRTTLMQETCALLGIENVRLKGNHALIAGELSDYSVHLGSAVVHQQPGGAVCLVPVHAQHRGRIFLPFVDDDPRTAEVIAKVLLLAKDKEIKDQTILEQLLH